MQTQEQELARKLRHEGHSVKEIERALGVSRSSVSRWVRDVQLSSQHRAALAARVGEGRLLAAARKAEVARATRHSYQAEGRERARGPDALYAAGCMLYWAEGEKSRRAVALSNSDPDLVRFFDRPAWLD